MVCWQVNPLRRKTNQYMSNRLLVKPVTLSLLLLSTVWAIAQPPAPVSVSSYAPPSNPRVLGTTFIDWDSLAPRTTAAGQSRAVFDNPTPTLEKLEVHITTLQPGMMSHPVHRHPWEEMLLVKEGSVVVSINGKKQPAGPGSLIFLASNDPHNAQNVSDKPATYYVINFYTDLVHTASDKSAAEQAVPGKLASSVFDCNSLPVTPTKTGSRAVVLSSPTLTFLALENHITTLNVGESTAADIVDPGDEIVVLKSGTIEVTVNGVTSRMKEGSLLYWAPNDKRTIRNVGTTPATYHVIRVTSARSPKAAGM
jgi:quercetin dioxygenase-like cupin family protein